MWPRVQLFSVSASIIKASMHKKLQKIASKSFEKNVSIWYITRNDQLTDCNYFCLFVLPAGGIWVKSFQIDQSALLKTFLSSTRGKTTSFAMSIWYSFFKLFGLFQSTKDINALRLAWPNLLMLLTCWPYLADLAWSKWNAAALWRFDMITNKWQRRILHINIFAGIWIENNISYLQSIEISTYAKAEECWKLLKKFQQGL